jgi:scyllo-inositol 2-dehydrogenase (NADP+)
MREAIRCGVVGFGLAGRVFHAAVISATPGLELTAIVQRSGQEAAEAYPQARIFRSVEELLTDDSIQLVAVGTPNDTHFSIAKQCLLAGRAVVVDKPFALSADEAAELIHIARERSLLLTAYQNRRWDGDFKTVRDLMASGELGRLVIYESHFDRFRAQPRPGAWRESLRTGGGIFFDLGPHLIDQALTLFGTPTTVQADIRTEREGFVTDDAFDLELGYARLTVWLRSTMLAVIPGPRFRLLGTQGSFVKFGIDPQEDAIRRGEQIGSPHWGEDPKEEWGTLKLADGSARRIPTQAGDYRGLYANVRDAYLGKTELAVKPTDAWRTARIIELARESSIQGRRLPADLGPEP